MGGAVLPQASGLCRGLVVAVFDERAKVGYEVAIRGVDKKRVET